jgi:hypothetical protein
MRSHEDRDLALACLKLACNHAPVLDGSVIDNAGKMLAFVTGAPDADAKLAEVRKLVA